MSRVCLERVSFIADSHEAAQNALANFQAIPRRYQSAKTPVTHVWMQVGDGDGTEAHSIEGASIVRLVQCECESPHDEAASRAYQATPGITYAQQPTQGCLHANVPQAEVTIWI